jgi:acyl-CoA reductase-like NAD-dependent aldehyde dehydrogenase
MTNRQKEVRAPFDGALIATIDMAGTDRAEQAMATAHGLFRDRDAWLPPSRRIEILRKAARLMEERAEPLALEAAREGGKPLVDSRVEVARALDGMLNCAEVLRSEAGLDDGRRKGASPQRIAAITSEPSG